MTSKQNDIIKRAAEKAHSIWAGNRSLSQPVELFIEDYTNAIEENDLEPLFYAIASLGMVEEARELTGLSLEY